jgi:hypothetical protein
MFPSFKAVLVVQDKYWYCSTRTTGTDYRLYNHLYWSTTTLYCTSSSTVVYSSIYYDYSTIQ